MITKGRSLVVLMVMITLVAVLLASSCAPGAAPERKEIVFGNSFPLTGAAADVGVPLAAGQLDCQKWVNEHGGINGIPIKTIWMDDGGMTPRCILNYKRARVKDMLLFTNVLSATMEAMVLTYQKDEIPAFFAQNLTVGMFTRPDQWIFAQGVGFGPIAATCMKWIKDNWKETRPPRVGAVIYDHVAGWRFLEGFEYANQFGVEYVGYEVVPFLGTLDTTIEILRLVDKKPDFILTLMCGATQRTFAMDLHRLEVQEQGIKIFDGLSGFDEAMIKSLGEAADGWYIVSWLPYASMESDLPGMKDLYSAIKKHRGWEPEEISHHSVLGWCASLMMVEATRLALEKVGIDNLDGRAIRDGFISIRDFETGLVPPATMTDDRPIMVDGYKLYQVQKGSITPVSDWIKPPYYLKPE